MICPKCDLEMKNRKIGNVLIDECCKCNGIWLDQGELEAAKDDIDPDLRWMDLELWKYPTSFYVGEKPVECPRCQKLAMTAIRYADTDIEIYYCPSCKGIWLEGGNLQRIIDHMVTDADSKDLSDYVKASLKEARDLVAHPENFISEWKDFRSVLRLLKYRLFVENPTLKNILVGIQKSLPL